MSDTKIALHVRDSAKGTPAAGAPDVERETLLELLAQQQRVAQTGLVTSALIHDINNHIQFVSGSAFLALQSENSDDWKAALEKVQKQCCALTETTRAFLNFVKRRDKAGHATFPISRAVKEVRRLTRSLAHNKNVQLVVSAFEEAEVRGEQRLVVQALVNLVTNAIRACTANDGQVAIVATCPTPGVCRVEVGDTGPGIPDQVRRRLFRPFVTGHGGSGGNGLGLFIVRQAVRRLGGSIRVSSSPRGTIFQVDLPTI